MLRASVETHDPYAFTVPEHVGRNTANRNPQFRLDLVVLASLGCVAEAQGHRGRFERRSLRRRLLIAYRLLDRLGAVASYANAW
jgi:hypothetical protein